MGLKKGINFRFLSRRSTPPGSPRSRFLRDHTAAWSRFQVDGNGKMPSTQKARRIPKNSYTGGKFQNVFYDRFAFPNKHQIISIRFDESLCGNSVNNSDCRAFSLFGTETGSGIKALAILFIVYKILENSYKFWGTSIIPPPCRLYALLCKIYLKK